MEEADDAEATQPQMLLFCRKGETTAGKEQMCP